MSATWYNSPERIAKLDEVARSWVGTPFRENSSAKGPRGAVSCHQLVAAVYKESGFLSADFTPPVGYVHQLKTSAPQAIIDWIDANLAERFSAVEPAAGFLPGDLIALRDDNDVLKHLGIVVSGRSFVHVLRMTGARISHLHDATFAPRIARIRRPMP